MDYDAHKELYRAAQTPIAPRFVAKYPKAQPRWKAWLEAGMALAVGCLVVWVMM